MRPLSPPPTPRPQSPSGPPQPRAQQDEKRAGEHKPPPKRSLNEAAHKLGR
jgi:hypothetical protein